MENPNIPPIPPKVAAAIAAVMKSVPKLKKEERNAHGNYNFASIDDFLEAVRPLCAEHGLIILQDEDGFETKESVGKDGRAKFWLVMRFSYTLAHASGETWSHRPVRTIMVDGSMGSQAFGAAQSYSLKQFQRSLFQIATGEKDADADSHPSGNLPPIDKATSTARKKAAVETWKVNAEAIKKAIDAAETEMAVDDLMAQEKKALEDIKTHSGSAHDFLVKRANLRAKSFSQEAA